MKKLMIMAAAVVAATVTQAASFDWYAMNMYSIDATTIAGGLTDGAHYSSATSGDANTMGAQTLSFATSWSYEITFDGTAPISGDFGSDFPKTVLITGLEHNHVYVEAHIEYSVLITGTLKDGNGATWALTSYPITGHWYVYENEGFSFQTNNGPAGWTVAAAIPEPTSELLMLLGMAGLALRRKRM